MVDPSSAFSALASAVKILYTLVGQEKNNVEEIARLAAHASSLHVMLSDRCSGGIPRNLLSLLEALNLTLSNIAVMLRKLQTQPYIKRLLWSFQISNCIAKAYVDINNACQLFSVGVHIDIRKAQEELEKARTLDEERARPTLQQLIKRDRLDADLLESLGVSGLLIREALISIQDQLPATSDPIRRRFFEQSVRALQRVSGPFQLLPDVPIITSLDVIITERSLGIGGYGQVYAGYWNGQLVAVKVLDKTVPEQMVIQEMSIWKDLQHPNILQFYGANPLSVPSYLVCAHMSNGDALNYLRQNPGADRVMISLDAANGLSYLHHKGIVHRDLKPSNILVNEGGRACLSDFGLAQIKTHTTTMIRQPDDSLSQRVGTVNYMAPEQLVRGFTNTATDIYSFGMTIYEIFTEEPPFSQCPDNLILQVVVDRQERPLRPCKEGTAIDDRVWSLIEHAWSPQPQGRPHASDLVAELSALVIEQRHNDSSRRYREILTPPTNYPQSPVLHGSDSPPADSLPRDWLDTSRESALPPHLDILQLLLGWVDVWNMEDLDSALQSTQSPNSVNATALTIWTTQMYKRLHDPEKKQQSPSRSKQRLKRRDVRTLYVPPHLAGLINQAISLGHTQKTKMILQYIWHGVGQCSDVPPKSVLALCQAWSDRSKWIVLQFSLQNPKFTSYQPESLTTPPPASIVPGWWDAIRETWSSYFAFLPSLSTTDANVLPISIQHFPHSHVPPPDRPIVARYVWLNLLTNRPFNDKIMDVVNNRQKSRADCKKEIDRMIKYKQAQRLRYDLVNRDRSNSGLAEYS